jgi:hypothetical protein
MGAAAFIYDLLIYSKTRIQFAHSELAVYPSHLPIPLINPMFLLPVSLSISHQPYQIGNNPGFTYSDLENSLVLFRHLLTLFASE